jgi:hypothetical protein
VRKNANKGGNAEKPDHGCMQLCADLREEAGALDVSPPPLDDPVPRQYAWMEATAAMLADAYGQRLERATRFRELLIEVKHASRSRALAPTEKREHRRMAKGLIEVLVLAEQAVSATDRWRSDLWDRTKVLLPAVAKDLRVVCDGIGPFDSNRIDRAVAEWRRIEVAAAERRASACEPKWNLSPEIWTAAERAAWRPPKLPSKTVQESEEKSIARNKNSSTPTSPRTDGYELFYSFSTKDESLRSKLETHLAMLKRENLIREWNFREIPPGTHFKNEIDKHLNTANIILLLVSADFLASDYCYTIEMKRAIERHKEGSAVVIPIILRPCEWHTAPFAGLEALPKNGKPVTSWRDRDKAFTDIAKGIRRTIESLKSEV